MKCEDCKFREQELPHFLNDKLKSKTGIGLCRRYPRNEVKDKDDWCGEFKPKEGNDGNT